MATIICDVDCTLLDPIFQPNGWYWYLQQNSSMPYSDSEFETEIQKTKGVINYDLSDYFPDVSRSEAFAFWQNDRLYQQLKPYAEAVEVLTQLGQRHKIVFVSFCKRHHQKSKYHMLHDTFKVNLPEGHFAFLATREKWAVAGDAVVDDRHEFLNQFSDREDCLKIKFETPYSQCQDLKVSLDLETTDWHTIGKFLNEVL